MFPLHSQVGHHRVESLNVTAGTVKRLCFEENVKVLGTLVL